MNAMFLSSLCSAIPSSYPLFLCVVDVFALILLYLPARLIFPFSPIIILTEILLLFLLRHASAASQKRCSSCREADDEIAIGDGVEIDQKSDSSTADNGSADFQWIAYHPDFALSFVEWDVGAPLFVIPESDEDLDECTCVKYQDRNLVSDPSLSMCRLETYSDVDCYSDSSSDDRCSVICDCNWPDDQFPTATYADDADEGKSQLFEDNLIELDLSPRKQLSDFRSNL